MPAMHREVAAAPHLIVINAERELLHGREHPNGGYKASARITTPDENPAHKNRLPYVVPHGAVFDTLQGALHDAEARARAAINAGFPER